MWLKRMRRTHRAAHLDRHSCAELPIWVFTLKKDVKDPLKSDKNWITYSADHSVLFTLIASSACMWLKRMRRTHRAALLDRHSCAEFTNLGFYIEKRCEGSTEVR